MCSNNTDVLGDIVVEIRDKLSVYCRDNCEAFCCRSGLSLYLDSREVENVFGSSVEVICDRRLLETEDKYRVSLSPCPAQGEDFSCKNYENRP